MNREQQGGRRLLILSSEFPPGPGGIGTHAHQLATELSRAGWSVRVVAKQQYASREEASAFNRRQAFAVEPLPDGHSALSAARRLHRMHQALAAHGAGLVMVSGERMVIQAALLLRGGTPWVAVEHGRTPGGLQKRLKQWAFSKPGAVVCVSDYTRRRLLSAGVRPRRAEVIHNGADVSRFFRTDRGEPSSIERELGIAGRPILVTVGSVSERKGQEVVIRALPRVLAEHPDSHYVCVGNRGELAPRLEALATELGVSAQVHFVGPRRQEDLVAILNRARLFVMTSQHAEDGFEGFGIAVLEAALCGIPAIVSGESGLKEAVEAEETGLVVPVSDPGATARAINRLLGDEPLARRMGDRAEQRARQGFTWERVACAYGELLDQLSLPGVVS